MANERERRDELASIAQAMGVELERLDPRNDVLEAQWLRLSRVGYGLRPGAPMTRRVYEGGVGHALWRIVVCVFGGFHEVGRVAVVVHDAGWYVAIRRVVRYEWRLRAAR